MENKTERGESEKVFCYTYDSLVRELSKKMVVREEVLVPEDGEVTIGDHESIYNWIKAIDFEEGKTPAIEATFSSEGGKKIVRLDTEKLAPVSSLEEKASKEDLLYSMALTEAKMKVVSAIAEEVYPAVAFQISDYRKEMGNMRDEILENKKQASSFDEVMHGALSRKNVVSAVVVGGLLLSSCVPIVDAGVLKPIEPTNNPAMTETFIPPTETTELSPTEVSVTEMPTATYELDLNSIVFPPVSDAKEAFDNGEYEEGLRDINQWVLIWNSLGFFDGSVKIDQLKLVVLDGSARVVCVASKDDKYTKTLYCPQIDMVNGGLRSLPEAGKEQESDLPLIINLENLEGLITRGKGSGMVYQFIDKYTKNAIRYIDAKTGNIVEGSYRAPLEVKENELVEKSTICVAKEFCMGGQMEIDPESAKIFYKGFLSALVHTEENKEYFESILGGDLSYEALTGYLDRNEGKIPVGLKLMRDEGKSYFSMTLEVDKPVNLSTLKVITFGSREWDNNVGNINEYINGFDKRGLSSPYAGELGATLEYFGWFVDDKGYLVFVSGSKDSGSSFDGGSKDNLFAIVGGKDGNYLPSRDNMIATSTFLSWIKLMERSDRYYGNRFFVEPLSVVVDAITASEEDIYNFFGKKTLFID